MPWIEAQLRGQRVLARVRVDGSLDEQAGRVEIRYNANDGRAYRAAARNLEVTPLARTFDDATCRPAVEPGGSPIAKSGAKAPREAPRVEPPAGESSARSGPTWVAYTDGACSGNPGPAGCGVVLVSPKGKTYEGLEFLGEATNNVAELTAILRAVQWAPAEALVVHTDSQYAIGVLQKGWKAKVNQELVTEAKALVKARRAHLVYVPGHRGVALNERADQLAREAVQTRRSRAVHADSLAANARV